jgi:hypothetical protein
VVRVAFDGNDPVLREWAVGQAVRLTQPRKYGLSKSYYLLSYYRNRYQLNG